jgi:hypothetical protein
MKPPLSLQPRRPKAAPPVPESTPIAKRTRSLKRTASLSDLGSDEALDVSPPAYKTPDKTLKSLKLKAKKLKQKLPSPNQVIA